MFGAIFYTVAAWLSASAAFVGVPVYFSIRADAIRADAAGIPALHAIPRVFVFVALGAWAVTFFGLVFRMTSIMVRPAPPSENSAIGGQP